MNNSPPDSQRPADLAIIERIEREAFLELYAAAPPAFTANFGIGSAEAVGYAMLGARAVPFFELNRVLGLGTEVPLTEEQLDGAIDWSERHCNPMYAIAHVVGAEPPELLDWLATRGFRREGTDWTKLRRGTDPVVPQPIATNLEVREIGPDQGATFGSIFAQAYGFPPDFADWIAGMVGRPKVRAYLAYAGTTPVGSGLMYVNHQWAWLGFGATLTEHRCQGAQAAILTRRIADGLAMGLHGFTVETTEQENSSYRNIERAGFKLAYTRANYHRPPGLGA